MSKKVIAIIILGLAIYALAFNWVLEYFDDSPTQMKWPDRQEFNRFYINKAKLQLLDFNQVIKQLGSPDITEAKRVDDNYYQLMYYRTQHMKSDGITSQDECTPLLFKNNKLIAKGEIAEHQYQSLIAQTTIDVFPFGAKKPTKRDN